ncbi:Uncharacterized membrane protein [Halogranum rubrum]|uniref:Uncharacterized membrane protein n=1 Tax=Halogranum rubrum TaxID=553466 RepID=A0A1I4JU15_9EURY|nr:DUF1616 domain-containing protein [Halogranum rubrum]SFL69954.1 Uncharacterized membrane protein [Halogranum rubrum]
MTRWYRSTGDLLVVALWTLGATFAVLVAGLEQSLLRTVLVAPLILIFPGYALLEVLFPERPQPSGTTDRPLDSAGARQTVDESSTTSLDGIERVTLAVVVNLGLVPLVAFVANYTPYGLTLQSVMTAITSVTLVFLLIGFFRRLRVSPDRRPRGVLARTPARLSRFLVGDQSSPGNRPLVPRTNAQRLFNLLLVVSLLVLAGSVGYAALTPPGDDNGFTETYLVTQTETGDYSSEALPRNFTVGESQRLLVALGNHEHERTTYTVVTTLDGRELSRTEVTVDDGETEYVEREITPQQAGDERSLQFFVYKGDAPETPSSKTAYQTADLWITVE